MLLLTLYATQYSGNTLIGYPGEAFRLGFSWVMSVGFMMAIIVVYLLFAPRLHHLAQAPPLRDTRRLGQPSIRVTTRLTLLANLLLVAAIGNYLLAQLIAMSAHHGRSLGRCGAVLGGRRAPDVGGARV